jgi:hypothetical protein
VSVQAPVPPLDELALLAELALLELLDAPLVELLADVLVLPVLVDALPPAPLLELPLVLALLPVVAPPVPPPLVDVPVPVLPVDAVWPPAPPEFEAPLEPQAMSATAGATRKSLRARAWIISRPFLSASGARIPSAFTFTEGRGADQQTETVAVRSAPEPRFAHCAGSSRPGWRSASPRR